MKTGTKLTKAVFTFFIIFIFSTSSAQTFNCESVKTGTYELVSPTSGKTIIYRTTDTQIEKNDTLNYEATFELKWVDSCIYELSNKKLIKGDIRLAGQPADILRVEIIKIEGNKILVKSSSNYSDRVVERTLTKLE